jgi:hypothetical protein
VEAPIGDDRSPQFRCERDAMDQHSISSNPATRAARDGTVPDAMYSHLPLATVDGHARRRSAYISGLSAGDTVPCHMATSCGRRTWTFSCQTMKQTDG